MDTVGGLLALALSGCDSASTDATAGGTLAGAMPDDAVSNRALPGIGNEASYNGRSVMVRVGNVTFNVEARRDYDYDAELSRTLAQQMVRNLERL